MQVQLEPSDLLRVGRGEEQRGLNLEAGHFRVEEHAGGSSPASLEGVTGDH